MNLKDTYRKLLAHYGPQHWWPGETPFEVMVGAVLTQNTAWTNVERAIANLKAGGALDAAVIVGTTHAQLAQWLRPSGYFNVKATRLRSCCDWYIARGGNHGLRGLPTKALRAELLAVKGIGPETADDILLYAFERPVFVIDAYTRRLFSRLGHVAGDEPYESLRGMFERELDGTETERAALFNEYHALIVRHAKEACRRRPVCGACRPCAGLRGWRVRRRGCSLTALAGEEEPRWMNNSCARQYASQSIRFPSAAGRSVQSSCATAASWGAAPTA